MTDRETEKRNAAIGAAAELQDGMFVGLGTGSTAAYAIREIGRRVREEGLRITATASSEPMQSLAYSLGILVRPMEDFGHLDLVIDGADEVDPQLNMIKGGGGALFREKIIAAAAARVVIAVDSSKRVTTLGMRPLPVEVHPFALTFVRNKLEGLGGQPTPRHNRNGSLWHTEQGAIILDAAFGRIDDAAALASTLDSIPGVLAHGLFIGLANKLIVGVSDAVEQLFRPLAD